MMASLKKVSIQVTIQVSHTTLCHEGSKFFEGAKKTFYFSLRVFAPSCLRGFCLAMKGWVYSCQYSDIEHTEEEKVRFEGVFLRELPVFLCVLRDSVVK